MVSDALVEEIRARADLAEICAEYTSLKRVGKGYRGPCPLHGGEGPNFAVDPDREIFKCFVCGEGGDVFGFLMKRLGLDFPSAVRHVAARVGVDVPEVEDRRPDPHAHLREVLAFAEEWFAEQLTSPRGDGARKYLTNRGIDTKIIEEYGLGYAPDEWRALKGAARTRGIEERSLLELGLLATSERTDEPYDRFRNRLMFSIRDLRDRPIGFGGRWLGAGAEEAPKYINSPDSPVFHKGRVLYGLNWARHAIRREGFVAIVEGYTDVVMLHRHGLEMAVAGLGTAFTPAQAEALGRYTKRAYLLYDSDDAGLRATFRTADVLLAAGIHPLVVTLPAGEDPDSIVRAHGAGAMRRYLGEAVDVLERKLQILEREGYLERIEGRRRAIDGLLSTLRAVRDPALRDIYLVRVVERTGVRRETLVSEVARAAAPGGIRRAPGAPPARGSSPWEAHSLEARGEESVERQLLLLLVRDPSLVGHVVRCGLKAGQFRHPAYRSIYGALAAARPPPQGGSDEPEERVEAWSAGLSSEAIEILETLLKDETELTDPGEILENSLRRLLHRQELERLREIDRELEMAAEAHARALLLEKQEIAGRLRAAGIRLSFLSSRMGEEAEIGSSSSGSGSGHRGTHGRR